MAKRGRSKSTVNITAENIGTALGRVAAKLDSWKKQRTEIASELARVVSTAQGMLSHLGSVEIPFPATANRGGRKKGYKMSAATKAKIRAAWEKRKAGGEAVVKKTRTLSAAAKARISAAQKKRWAERKKMEK